MNVSVFCSSFIKFYVDDIAAPKANSQHLAFLSDCIMPVKVEAGVFQPGFRDDSARQTLIMETCSSHLCNAAFMRFTEVYLMPFFAEFSNTTWSHGICGFKNCIDFLSVSLCLVQILFLRKSRLIWKKTPRSHLVFHISDLERYESLYLLCGQIFKSKEPPAWTGLQPDLPASLSSSLFLVQKYLHPHSQ